MIESLKSQVLSADLDTVENLKEFVDSVIARKRAEDRRSKYALKN